VQPVTIQAFKHCEVLKVFTEARTVIMLNALADLLEPMQRASNVYQTAGCKIDLLTAELNTLSEKLELLEETCVDIHSVGGDRMRALQGYTNNLAIEEGFIAFKHGKCTIKLGLNTFSATELVSEYRSIVRGVREQISERFPEDERGLAHLFSIFQIESIQRQTAMSIATFGEHEIEMLVDTLSKAQATGRDFFCKVPFIDPSAKSQVFFISHACAVPDNT
jgi:hypothetical protein